MRAMSLEECYLNPIPITTATTSPAPKTESAIVMSLIFELKAFYKRKIEHSEWGH